jgi:TolB-like protein
LDKLEKWFWYLGCFFVGLSGCQGHLQGSVQFPDDSDPSSYVEPHRARSLDPPYSLAILPLDNLSNNARLHWLGRSLSEMLASDLAKWPSLSIIARDALGPVLREQWLQQRGFSSSISDVNLGNIQGVHYLVNGGFHQYGDNLTIDLQVIDVESGVVVSSLRAKGPEEEIPRLEHNLVMQMLTLFDPSIDSTTSDLSHQLEEKSPKLSSPGRIEEKDGCIKLMYSYHLSGSLSIACRPIEWQKHFGKTDGQLKLGNPIIVFGNYLKNPLNLSRCLPFLFRCLCRRIALLMC